MISKGLCDTEDWSNDAENSALHHKNLIFNLNNTSQYYYFYCFWSNKCSLAEQKIIILKTFLKSYRPQTIKR